jgi:hypothetical protein
VNLFADSFYGLLFVSKSSQYHFDDLKSFNIWDVESISAPSGLLQDSFNGFTGVYLAVFLFVNDFFF